MKYVVKTLTDLYTTFEKEKLVSLGFQFQNLSSNREYCWFKITEGEVCIDSSDDMEFFVSCFGRTMIDFHPVPTLTICDKDK